MQIEESGFIDGCGVFRSFFKLVFPLTKPAIMAVAIINFLSCWREYLFAVVFTSDDKSRTLTVGLANLSGAFVANYALSAAGIMVYILPVTVFYLLLQKQVVKGMIAGAIKG
jgi:raffinose/stachyose/melibiose transport system permease protein